MEPSGQVGARSPPEPQGPEQQIKAVGTERDGPGGEGSEPETAVEGTVDARNACAVVAPQGRRSCEENEDWHNAESQAQGDCRQTHFLGPPAGQTQPLENRRGIHGDKCKRNAALAGA